MSDMTVMLERNREFAGTYSADLQILPRFSTLVLTCVDARVNPTHFLQLELGDAIVLRNAGARVTHDIELELGVLWTMASAMAGDRFSGMSLAIVQHSDCGYERLANPQLRGAIVQNLGADPDELEHLAIHDHHQSLHGDIARLRQSALVPNALVVAGYMYDVTTGLVEEVIEPAPLAGV